MKELKDELLQDFLKRHHTPHHSLKKLDLHSMDERSFIEQHSQLRNELILMDSQKQRGGRLGQSQTLSPPCMKHNLMMKSTTLKFKVEKLSNGNIEDIYSQTTRIISGHNTPLPSMQKTREKYLTQINKD